VSADICNTQLVCIGYTVTASEFNVVGSVVEGSDMPAEIILAHGNVILSAVPAGVEPRLAGCKSVALTH